MYILGLSSYAHESSCSLIKDGEVRVIIEEERYNRIKHTWSFPENAIKKCLEFEGISFNDIERITFFWVPLKEIISNVNHVLKYFPSSLNLLRGSAAGEGMNFVHRIKAMQTIGQKIKEHFHLTQPPPVEFIEHHLCHASNSFHVSPFSEAAILTIDGRGESVSTMLAVGKKNKIQKIIEIKVPHSLGHLYAAITDYLGFKAFFDEWKVMGMSAYGQPNNCEAFDDVVYLLDNGEYRLNLKYFNFHKYGQGNWLSHFFLNTFGPKRKKEDNYEQRHFDIALALQKTVEKTGVHLANGLYRQTRLPNLCMSGGVVLNCLMNKKIIENSPFTQYFIQPIANDAGTSLGSALYYYHSILDKERGWLFNSIYLGPEFDNNEIEGILRSNNVVYKKSNHIARKIAGYIAEGKIVGWFQGRMEAGPRALGNRSIIVNPMDSSMKDRLNQRVKKREFFRPFAPSVLEEKVDDYFIMPKGQLSPYMILVGDVKEDKKSIIPAVTHFDGTARVHTVNKEVNPRFWELISEFEKITGVPVLLNTSFNENEPIVCTPEEAIKCFLRTEFDVLGIGDFLVLKANA